MNEAGEERVTTLAVTLTPPQPVPSAATRPPVILLNGWQFSSSDSCPISSSSADTFGSLQAQLLADGAPVAYFFDNCVEGANAQIEDLGNILGQVLNLIRYDTGALVPQVDLVGHSMGGLIVRSYLAGLQTNGSLSPPINPRVRKFIEIATPNFGSFVAANDSALIPAGTQTAEMIPGSIFLWYLATWNQRGDDLQGVDTLAIIGNGGSSGADDGLVSLTSASALFAIGVADERTRIVPYCHTIPGSLFGPFCPSNTPPIANVTEAPETGQIVLSFLAGTPSWTSIGKTPAADPSLSRYGGVYFEAENASGQDLNDLTQVTFGTVPLQNGGATGRVFYNESLVAGTGTFQATGTSSGTVTYGPFVESVGRYSTAREKLGPVILSVSPLLANTPGRIVASGATITIGGAGFGQQQCSTCQVLAGGVPLQKISSWSDQTISAFLPATCSGIAQLVVQTASGKDGINIMTAAPTPPVLTPTVCGVLNGASFTAGAPVAPGSIFSIFGSNLATSISTASSTPLPTMLLTTSVTINGVPIPLYYVSPAQINAQVPFEIPAGTAALAVLVNEIASPAITVSIDPTAPGIFLYGANRAVAVNPDGSINASNHPAKRGDVIVLYMTGQGAVSNSVTTGGSALGSPRLSEALATTTATIGSTNAEVQFSGLAPGFVGLLQVNILVPSVPAGDQPLVVTIGGKASNSALITVTSQ